MTGEEQTKKESKGFAGLSSLVSDVDTTPTPTPKSEPAAAAPSAERPASPQPAEPQPQPSQRQTYQEPAQHAAGGISEGKQAFGCLVVAVVIGMFWLVSQSDRNTTYPISAYTPPAQSTALERIEAAPAYTPPAQSAAPSYSPPAQPQAPSHPQESQPPVGQNVVLSTAQIRYCLAEDIRLNGAKSAVNNYIDSDVDRFNAMVADYNSRCSSFKYQTNNRGRNDLNSAQRDIEPYRTQLQVEGRNRFARSPSTGSLSAPAPSRPAPDATVQAVQRKLNELGYSAGTPDGLMGRNTRSAIVAFQQDNGLVADGNATAALLQLLTASRQAERQEAQAPAVVAVVPPTYTPSARTPSRQEARSSTRGGIPQNAHLNYLGNDWECNRGYFKYGNECRSVQIPQNGKLTYLGNDWECNRGYFKYGNECRAVKIPQDGKLTYLGNDWECNRGFRKSGDRCVSVFQQ